LRFCEQVLMKKGNLTIVCLALLFVSRDALLRTAESA